MDEKKEREKKKQKQMWVRYRNRSSKTQAARVVHCLLSDGPGFSLIRPDWHSETNTLRCINQHSDCFVLIKVDTAVKPAKNRECRFCSGAQCASHWANDKPTFSPLKEYTITDFNMKHCPFYATIQNQMILRAEQEKVGSYWVHQEADNVHTDKQRMVHCFETSGEVG